VGARTSVWLVGGLVALGAGFAAGWVSAPMPGASSTPPSPTPSVEAEAEPAAPSPADAGDLAALRTCMHRLGETEAGLARECGAPAAGAGLASAPPVPTRAVGSAGAAAAGAPAPPAGAAAEARAFSRAFMSRVVGAPDAEAAWLQEYACLVDDLRSRTERDLALVLTDPTRAGDRAALDLALLEAREERNAMLAEVRSRLGKERYKRLRDVGGLAILSRACDAPATDTPRPRAQPRQ
jgi:hypothetical protein